MFTNRLLLRDYRNYLCSSMFAGISIPSALHRDFIDINQASISWFRFKPRIRVKKKKASMSIDLSQVAVLLMFIVAGQPLFSLFNRDSFTVQTRNGVACVGERVALLGGD